jgi:hypothetical protein
MVGASVGAMVAEQVVVSDGFVTKPSKHWHTQAEPCFTAMVVDN